MAKNSAALKILHLVVPYTLYQPSLLHATMRVVDMDRHRVVKCGVDWPFESTPNSKRMITQLERNEALVTWIQPVNGSVTDQFPAIRIRDQYYTMSLRMMKVSRHRTLANPSTVCYLHNLWFTERMASRAPEAELRQPRDDPARGREAADPGGAAGGEDAHAAAV